jgi:tetratricopeptide (TPR) repeat protein
MGRKQSGVSKPVCLCVALLIFLSPLACSLSNMMNTKMVDVSGEEASTHLVLGKTYLAQGEFEKALKENKKVISLASKNVLVDQALFYIGLIYVHPGTSVRDYGKAIVSFKRLIRGYPGSLLVEQAKTMLDLLHENDVLDRTIERLSHTIEEQKKKNDRMSNIIEEQKKTEDRLNYLIDELKQVDIDAEQKKRERAK